LILIFIVLLHLQSSAPDKQQACCIETNNSKIQTPCSLFPPQAGLGKNIFNKQTKPPGSSNPLTDLLKIITAVSLMDTTIRLISRYCPAYISCLLNTPA
jgi:hypothetical protein